MRIWMLATRARTFWARPLEPSVGRRLGLVVAEDLQDLGAQLGPLLGRRFVEFAPVLLPYRSLAAT
jgi:hypothetical protein